jgi:hypothetical protein
MRQAALPERFVLVSMAGALITMAENSMPAVAVCSSAPEVQRRDI